MSSVFTSARSERITYGYDDRKIIPEIIRSAHYNPL
jgi:hypothetical protein